MRNRITDKPIPLHELENELHDPSCGGLATFVGKVRNHHEGKKVTSLAYEAFAPMAEKIFDEISREAIDRWGVKKLSIVHRVGHLQIGDIAVWVGVEAEHRNEAFLACRYAIDELKKRAPIWKKEYNAEGDSQWVVCNHV